MLLWGAPGVALVVVGLLLFVLLAYRICGPTTGYHGVRRGVVIGAFSFGILILAACLTGIGVLLAMAISGRC